MSRCDVCMRDVDDGVACGECTDLDAEVKAERDRVLDEVLAVIDDEIEYTPPFDAAVPALRRLKKRIEALRGDGGKKR